MIQKVLWGGLFDYWQRHGYFRPSNIPSVNGNFSLVTLNKGLAQEKAQSHAVLLGRIERLEYPVPL